MANTLTAIIPKILTAGLEALREQAVIIALVNSDLQAEAAKKGSTIDVPFSSSVAVVDVTPANTPPATADLTEDTVQLVLDQWKEAPFYLTDKEQREIETRNMIPRKVTEAVKSLANEVANTVYATHSDFFGFAGTPGTTPFAADTSAATDARKVLNNQLAPMSPRFGILDPDAEANALGLRAFQDASFRGDTDGIREGQIGRKLGFDWQMDQLIPSHTNGGSDGAYLVNGAIAVGVTAVVVDTGTGTMTKGEIFEFSGHTQTYVVTDDPFAGGAGTINFQPTLQEAVADNETITSKGAASTAFPQNLAFHRDAIALAVRPMTDEQGLGNLIMSAVDPQTGLPLRLEVSREHKRTRWSFDLLWGVKVIRRELGMRIYG